MFDSDWQEGNIDRAAYITLKVDGFPFDEVYEVMMMYIQKIVSAASSTQAQMQVLFSWGGRLWEMVGLTSNLHRTGTQWR
jgi:hypothetical protein